MESAPRKRLQSSGHSQIPSSRRATEGGVGINKTLTIVGTRTPDIRGNKGVVGVELRPHERWIGVSTVPLRVFQLFNLPQDAMAYAERSRDELVDRCLSRAGRVTSLF